jgi:biopolymer transport protein ExbD
MKLRRSRARRKGRIEIIPMIDVMFFLLATFMLASLSLQHLNSLAVNLPQGHAAPLAATTPLTLTVTQKGDLLLNATPVTIDSLGKSLEPLLARHAGNLIVAADSGAPSGVVVEAMLRAREVGAQHFLMAIKHE